MASFMRNQLMREGLTPVNLTVREAVHAVAYACSDDPDWWRGKVWLHVNAKNSVRMTATNARQISILNLIETFGEGVEHLSWAANQGWPQPEIKPPEIQGEPLWSWVENFLRTLPTKGHSGTTSFSLDATTVQSLIRHTETYKEVKSQRPAMMFYRKPGKGFPVMCKLGHVDIHSEEEYFDLPEFALGGPTRHSNFFLLTVDPRLLLSTIEGRSISTVQKNHLEGKPVGDKFELTWKPNGPIRFTWVHGKQPKNIVHAFMPLRVPGLYGAWFDKLYRESRS